MLLDRSNIRKWLKARKFEITNEENALKAELKLSKNRVIGFGMVGDVSHYKNMIVLEAKMKWNDKTLFYHSVPMIQFYFYLPIEHSHVDKILKMMIKWTKFAFEEYKNKRLTL
jgi:hypothetical protein